MILQYGKIRLKLLKGTTLFLYSRFGAEFQIIPYLARNNSYKFDLTFGFSFRFRTNTCHHFFLSLPHWFVDQRLCELHIVWHTHILLGIQLKPHHLLDHLCLSTMRIVDLKYATRWQSIRIWVDIIMKLLFGEIMKEIILFWGYSIFQWFVKMESYVIIYLIGAGSIFFWFR